MRRILLALSLVVTALCFSCKKDLQSFPVGVDFQSQYENDNVSVYIDNEQLFGKFITTNNVLSLAASTQTKLEEGKHEIMVLVNSHTLREKFSVTANLYLGINYNKDTQKISIIYSPQRFVYD